MTRAGREHESAIDCILVNEDPRKHVLDMFVDEDRLADVPTDHNMIVMNTGEMSDERQIDSKSKDRT